MFLPPSLSHFIQNILQVLCEALFLIFPRNTFSKFDDSVFFIMNLDFKIIEIFKNK